VNKSKQDKSRLVKSNERLDDLELDDLMIIQKENGYKFSTDSVLLSDFAKVKPSNFYVDLCSGSGVVAILVAHKNNAQNVLAVEIQQEMSEMAVRSVEYNDLSSRINVLNENLNKLPEILGYEKVDVITVNPPYNEVGETSSQNEIAIATHEICTNLSEICLTCSKILKYGGKVYMVHRADRLADILVELRKNKIEPKVLRFVYPKKDKQPNVVLIEAKKGAQSGLKFISPLILNNDDGSETDELKRIYNRKNNL